MKESEVSYQKPSSLTGNESETSMEELKNPKNWGKMNQKPPKLGENEQKPPFPTILYKNVYDAICMNPKIKYSQIEENLGIGESSIHRAIGWLKENGYINSERSKVKGVWQIEK